MPEEKILTFRLKAHAMYVTKAFSWEGSGKKTETNCWACNWEATLKHCGKHR